MTDLPFILGPLHARAKGRDHVTMRALDSHPKAIRREMGKLFLFIYFFYFVEIGMVCLNLCQAYLLEVGFMQIWVYNKILSIIC